MSETVVLCASAPLVPVTVTTYVPAGVLPLVLILITVDPEPTRVFGLKLADALAGSPLALKVTVPVKPPEAVTVTVKFAFEPATTDLEPGVADSASVVEL